jgi:hypothetical protein
MALFSMVDAGVLLNRQVLVPSEVLICTNGAQIDSVKI